MYSTFYISTSQCMTCNNEVLKQLGELRGVFGANMDRIDGKIEVNHTDEITREEIRVKLDKLGWKEIQTENNILEANDIQEVWRCTIEEQINNDN